MDSAMSVITISIAAVFAVLLVFSYTRKRLDRGGFPWLVATLIFSLLAVLTYLLPADWSAGAPFTRGLLLVLLMMGAVATYGGLAFTVLHDGSLRHPVLRVWLGVTVIWAVVVAISAAVQETATIGLNGWLLDLFRAPDAVSYIFIGGFVLVSVLLLALLFYIFYRAHLPEIANRALFWIVNAAGLFIGILMTISGTDELAAAGMILVVTALMGASYANISDHVFDIRNATILSLRTAALMLIATVLIFNALYIAVRADLPDNAERIVVLVGISIAIAAIFIPLRQMSDFITRPLMRQTDLDSAQVTRTYGSAVSQAMELDTLITASIHSLIDVMRVSSGCLLLLNSTFKLENAVELLVMCPEAELDGTIGSLSLESTLYHALAVQQRAITQFDLEYSNEFREVPAAERAFFERLHMNAFAPIILENALIGILASGPKLDDTPFFRDDLELLLVLAQQTGVAIRNARMIDDLRHLNRSMQSLNQTLKRTNEQLNRIDSVKSDFVTIASHELRTPLSQVRGYTDIIESLNAQGMLDEEQASELTAKLGKAVDRMEELIAAMLDVSQLDVAAMDLNFNETSLESVLRMAIEPLTEAIRQRKLRLSARGLSVLPSIQADLQRLVQAFRNIIVNAIKFTPDGGRIDIRAELIRPDHESEIEIVLIEISDTGVGINKQNLEMIFKKFFRAYDPSLHSTGATKFLGAGPGLGLTIARGVIEGHGGEVWAESEGHDMQRNPGSTFWIRLPVSTPETARRVLTFEGDVAGNALRRTDELDALLAEAEAASKVINR